MRACGARQSIAADTSPLCNNTRADFEAQPERTPWVEEEDLSKTPRLASDKLPRRPRWDALDAVHYAVAFGVTVSSTLRAVRLYAAPGMLRGWACTVLRDARCSGASVGVCGVWCAVCVGGPVCMCGCGCVRARASFRLRRRLQTRDVEQRGGEGRGRGREVAARKGSRNGGETRNGGMNVEGGRHAWERK